MYVARHKRRTSLFEDFSRFLMDDFQATSLDEYGDAETRPDFRKNSFLIEIKSLETPPTEKIENLIEPMMDKNDFPFAFGYLSEKHFADHAGFQASYELILKKIQKSVRDHLKKANRQIREYASKNNISSHGIVAFLNEEIIEFPPEIVMHAINSEIKSGKQPSRTGYGAIDSIFYICESHFNFVPNPPYASYPLCHMLNGDFTPEHAKAATILDLWAKRASSPELLIFRGDGSKGNGAIYIIPDKMKMHELWRHNYRKNRKFCSYSKSKLSILFCQTNMLFLLFCHKSSPGRSNERLTEYLPFLTEVHEEINLRGLDIRALIPKNNIQKIALSELKITKNEREWIRENFRFQQDRESFTPN